MKIFVKFSLLLIPYLIGINLSLVQSKPVHLKSSKPNVIIIYADDLGYGDLSCMGATKIQTPNIDKLAEGGRLFTDAHSVSAVCTPSRYALLTGEYPFRIGNFAPVFCNSKLIIDTTRTTLADVFKSSGYYTACVGKWHSGFGNNTPDWNEALKPGPLELGFDYYYGVPVVNSHPPFVYVENYKVMGLEKEDPLVLGRGLATHSKEYPQKFARPPKHMWSVAGGKKAHDLYEDELVMTNLTHKVTSIIEEKKDSRFFIYFATTAIHHPFTPNEKFKGTSQCGVYGDFVHELDWSVGEIMKTLEENNLLNNTLVIFTSDNGGMLNLGGTDAWQSGHRMNGELLGFKFGAWEGGHRVPFIAHWPEHIPAASKSNKLIANIDLLATFAELLNFDRKPEDGRDSYNQLNTLVGNPENTARKHLLIQAFEKERVAIRWNDWIYIPGQGSGGFGNGLEEIKKTKSINSDITLEGTIKENAPKNQLYNLKTDIKQTTNVIKQNPKVAKRLQTMLEKQKQ